MTTNFLFADKNGKCFVVTSNNISKAFRFSKRVDKKASYLGSDLDENTITELEKSGEITQRFFE